jgi:DNA-binding MarR family transcriptional regulator
MGKQHRIALDLIWLGKAMRQYIGRDADKSGVEPITGTQAFILDYLYTAERRGVDIFQRDIERQFGIGRSATSGMLQLMEKNGMINRTSVPQDARLKKITLTEKYRQTQDIVSAQMDEKERHLAEALTPEETETFWILFDKLRNAVIDPNQVPGQGAVDF